METGQDHAGAKGTGYGAPAHSSAAEDPQLPRGPSSPVHANVDSPFRPLAAFVPEAHWQRLERPEAGPWGDRLHGIARRARPVLDRAGHALRRIMQGIEHTMRTRTERPDPGPLDAKPGHLEGGHHG